ncbi:MAG: ABC transporter permease [Clostridiales bacterium]|jgi:ABC-2 type transport system permease protein|nr:ABC transporter permease [Clostridiales bacterium]
MFGKLYLGELKKLARPKALITLAVLCVALFIVFVIIYNMQIEEPLNTLREAAESTENFTEATGDGVFDYYQDYISAATPENVDELIAELNETKKTYEERNKKKETKGQYGAAIKELRCGIAMLEYMKAHNVYGKNLNVEGYASYYAVKNAESFALYYFRTIAAILTIYGIVMAAGLYADEYARGTIKLVMLRPVTKNQVTTAKLLALFTYILGILGVASLLGYAYGAIAYKSVSAEKVYVVFNASSVFACTVGGTVLYKMFFAAVKVLSFASLSYAIGTILRKKTPAIILSFIVYLGIISALFTIFGGERFLFSTNTDLSVYFGFGVGEYINGGNFFLALPLLVIYLAAIISSTYLVVNKRDVI